MEPSGGGAGQFIEPPAAGDDLHHTTSNTAPPPPDIKSIMLANDRLMGELVRSLQAGLTSDHHKTTPTAGHTVAMNRGRGQLHELLADSDERQHDDSSSLQLLDDLIRKSAVEFQALEAHFQQQTRLMNASSSSSSLAGFQADEPTEAVAPPAASGKATPLQTSGAVRWPLDGTEPPAAGVYSNCRQLPECQAGGLCATDQVDSGAPAGAPLRSRARCRCPLGRGGLLCQRSLQISVPSFWGRSYLALPMPAEEEADLQNEKAPASLKQLRLVFRPAAGPASIDGRASLLLSSPSFILLLDPLNRVQLRYTSRWGPTRVMGSRDASLDSWNELIVTPDASNDSNMIQQPQQPDAVSEANTAGNSSSSRHQFYDIRDKIVLVTPAEIPLAAGPHHSSARFSSRGAQLFVGGLPQFAASIPQNSNHNNQQDAATSTAAQDETFDRLLSPAVGAGFRGCIKELSINGRAYNFGSDFRGDALDGFDINECGFREHSLTPMDEAR